MTTREPNGLRRCGLRGPDVTEPAVTRRVGAAPTARHTPADRRTPDVGSRAARSRSSRLDAHRRGDRRRRPPRADAQTRHDVPTATSWPSSPSSRRHCCSPTSASTRTADARSRRRTGGCAAHPRPEPRAAARVQPPHDPDGHRPSATRTTRTPTRRSCSRHPHRLDHDPLRGGPRGVAQLLRRDDPELQDRCDQRGHPGHLRRRASLTSLYLGYGLTGCFVAYDVVHRGHRRHRVPRGPAVGAVRADARLPVVEDRSSSSRSASARSRS